MFLNQIHTDTSSRQKLKNYTSFQKVSKIIKVDQFNISQQEDLGKIMKLPFYKFPNTTQFGGKTISMIFRIGFWSSAFSPNRNFRQFVHSLNFKILTHTSNPISKINTNPYCCSRMFLKTFHR